MTTTTMEIASILDSLNPAQQKAVSAPLGHLLILAGAGSGKTRVLTHRIAWLIQQEGLSPLQVLAVTFTNKAAHEMRSRIESLLHQPTQMMWIGTFHGLSHRMLRAHWQEAGLPQSFHILDADDQLRMLRRIIQNLNLDEERFPPKQAQWFINAEKEKNRLPYEVIAEADGITEIWIKIYHAYQEACQRVGAIDFTDLLLKVCRLLQAHPAILAHYQSRFKSLLVDEFQDTNTLQYTWLRLLAGEENAVMIVGDDDQSIYGWRGAKIENMQRFSKDFPNAVLIRLEQNYRSTETILNAANALISFNSGRLGKNLWTAGNKGEPITLYAGFNDLDEAYFIASVIRDSKPFNRLSEIAILYRSNAQSRVIEESLMQLGIAYRVYGGLRFFDRAEIKDALAYLRLLANPNDDSAFDRVINTPPRGIGERTLLAIREQAHASQCSLWKALNDLLANSFFSARSENALSHFQKLILSLQEKIDGLPLQKQVEHTIQESGLIAYYQKEKGEKGLNRIENLEELINAAYQFSQEVIPDEIPLLAAFLAYTALESDDNKAHSTTSDAVQLMTLHTAKGLEFPIVFLSGCEEELFPHYLSMQDPKALEEERRLCYVGMTRAMKKLYMTYAEIRRMHGKELHHRPSRFLNEIPKELVEEKKLRTKVSYFKGYTAKSNSTEEKASSSFSNPSSPFQNGEEVYHRIFGKGTVLNSEGKGGEAKITVRFPRIGTKILMASFLNKKESSF